MNIYEQTNQSFSEITLPLRSAVSRYWFVSWAPAVVVCALALFLTFKIPSYYVSDVLISIQPQKLTAKIVDSPSKEDQTERFQSLILEMISRPRLMGIMDKLGLYPELVSRGVKGREEALQKFRKSIEITPEDSTTGQRLSQTFRLGFSHTDAKTAYEVTKAISNLFIDESILSKKGETEGTVEFLDAQLRTAREKLENTEKQVQGFVRANFGKLPEHLQAAVARLESNQQQLATNAQLITAKTQKLEFLRQELKIDKGVPVFAGGPSGGDNNDDPVQSLAQLEAALAVLRSRYSDQHPDVIAAKSRIQALRQQISAGAKSDGKNGPRVVGTRMSPETRNTRHEMADLEAELASLNQDNTHLKKSIDELESDIKEMPLKEQELIKINRDYNNVKANYEKLMAAREEAGLQRDLVSSQKGTQFKVVDPAAVPLVPSGPPRLIIAISGLLLSGLVFFGLPMALYFLNSGFKYRDEIENELGINVIGVIPPMETPKAMMLARKAVSASLAASVISFVAGSVLILLLV
jgi:polysaccharide chain length determinant protein (PEP-CTERM system associated)